MGSKLVEIVCGVAPGFEEGDGGTGGGIHPPPGVQRSALPSAKNDIYYCSPPGHSSMAAEGG